MMQKKETLRTLFLVRTGRFELPTSCLSSKRSKPTELSPHCFGNAKIDKNFVFAKLF